MSKDKLFRIFESMFPEYAKRVTSYRKIGSRALAIILIRGGDEASLMDQGENEESSRVFLYYGPGNWTFGTKLYRKRPKKNEAKNNTIQEEVKKQ